MSKQIPSTDKDVLIKILASTFSLYLKTQNYHWNVKGPAFYSLHNMFEEQYSEMASAIDEIAERISFLGHYVPGSFSEYANLSVINEEKNNISANDMIDNLVSDNLKLSGLLKEGIEKAEKSQDEVTVDMLIERMSVHDKNSWMLKSMK